MEVRGGSDAKRESASLICRILGCDLSAEMSMRMRVPMQTPYSFVAPVEKFLVVGDWQRRGSCCQGRTVTTA
jgi:hypothetical protein